MTGCCYFHGLTSHSLPRLCPQPALHTTSPFPHHHISTPPPPAILTLHPLGLACGLKLPSPARTVSPYPYHHIPALGWLAASHFPTPFLKLSFINIRITKFGSQQGAGVSSRVTWETNHLNHLSVIKNTKRPVRKLCIYIFF